jgi:hypothetical protein
MRKYRLWLFVLCLWSCSPLQAGMATDPPQDISPSATSEALITYQDVANQFELKYSLEDYSPDPYQYPGENFALLLDVNKLFAGKNLEEVRVNVAVNPKCRSTAGYSPLTSEIESVIIHGVEFTKYSARDAGTHSNTFEHITYQTQHAEHCYEITVSVREYRLDVFPDLTEYSKDLLNSKLDLVIQSFRFLDS